MQSTLAATFPRQSDVSNFASGPVLQFGGSLPVVNMKNVATIILGGGQGTRLFPLTMSRCKPAMCYGGRYRLIDIPISNAVNSGSQMIYIITQFLSSTLHQHIFNTYRFGSLSSGFIELLSAEQKPQNNVWFQGTADAVRQNLDHFIEIPADYFLILSGDQLYRMNFREMVYFAQKTNADAVIASLPIPEADAKRMGVMQIDHNNFITSFHEKPQQRNELNRMLLTPSMSERLNLDPLKKLDYLGSMGIYLFKRKTLIDLLQRDPREDFGKHLIPTIVKEGNSAAYIHEGYWEDIGTVESFYQANMALTHSQPLFDCYNEEWPIFASQNTLPGARIMGNTQVHRSILCEGSIIDAQEVAHSVLGPRSVLDKGVIIQNSYVMGNDYFHPPTATSRLPKTFRIGENSVIKKAIIDKHVSIGRNVQLVNKQNLTHYDSENVYIRDGIIVVSKGATIPDGFIL